MQDPGNPWLLFPMDHEAVSGEEVQGMISIWDWERKTMALFHRTGGFTVDHSCK